MCHEPSLSTHLHRAQLGLLSRALGVGPKGERVFPVATTLTLPKGKVLVNSKMAHSPGAEDFG